MPPGEVFDLLEGLAEGVALVEELPQAGLFEIH